MDPLSALGLASAVVQFLDFGAKVFRASQDILGAGSTVSNTQLRGLVLDLGQVTSSLTTKIDAHGSHQLSKEEQALYDLATQCGQAADELQKCLDTLVSRSSRRQVWKSIRIALCTVWHEDHIEKLAQRIEEYRSQLTLRLLLVLNSHNQLQNEKLDRLQSASKEIVEVVSLNYRDLTADINRLNAETIAAIFIARDGNTSSMTAGNSQQYMEDLRFSASSTTYTHGSENFITRMDVNHVKVILDALHFREISERRGTILPAHMDTFEWIWRASESDEEIHWDNLMTWLEHGHGCYWISGKAGSGKSSLMNYLQADPRMSQSLERWAGTSQLIIASFYFWYAGNDLQKSQTGLLRSLLLGVLSRRPDLCVALFPDISRSILSGHTQGHALDLTHAELRSGLSRLIHSVPKDVTLFFFIDGLDEYSGDLNDICDLFSQIASSPSIKILVSSRPIPVCVEKFLGCPKLRLQDLTWNDINKYTSDYLGSNNVLQGMETIEPGVTSRLVKEVTLKACGVFLWVVLVVQRLIVGLQNYETIAELEKEIERLPSDLEKLYEHMLGSQSEQHRLLGSKYLQLVLRSMEMSIDLHLFQLSFAEQDNYAKPLRDHIQKLTADAEKWVCKATEGRLRSRCCGLIETQDAHAGQILTKSDKKVAFFHRTVVEFLQLDNIWSKLESLTLKSGFNAERALVSSALAEVKMAPLPDCLSSPSLHEPLLQCRLFRILGYESNVEHRVREAFHDLYLPEFKRVVQFYWHDPSLFASPDEEFEAVNASISRARTQMNLKYPETFILSCLIRTPTDIIFEGYSVTPAHMVMHFVDETDPRICRSIARHILLRARPSFSPEASANFDGAFLDIWSAKWRDISASPDRLRSITLWQYLLYYIFAVVDRPQRREACAVMSSPGKMISLLDAILVMVQADGDLARPNIGIAVMRSNNPIAISDITLVAELLWKFWAKATSSPTTCNSETLADIASRSCTIEDLISRQMTQSTSFRLTLQELVNGELQAQQSSSEVKEKNVSTNVFGFRWKSKVKTNKQAPELLQSRPASTVPSIFESPWRTYKERAQGIMNG